MKKAVLSCVFLLSAARALSFISTDRKDLKHGDLCRHDGGPPWTCLALHDCPSAHRMLHSRERPQLCNYTGAHPEVCCEPEPSPGRRRSVQYCDKYAGSVFIHMDDKVHMNYSSYDSCSLVEPLISFRQQSEPREFPHMALVGHGFEEEVSWKCGGALISELIVLTAAHCPEAQNGEQSWARLGEYHVESKRDDNAGLAQPMDYPIAERINHPLYRRPLKYNDIALHRLAKRVVFDEYIRPVCLHSSHALDKAYAIATGWGEVMDDTPGTVLLKGNASLVAASECARAYAGAPQLPRGLEPDTMLCAANPSADRDTRSCQTDKGGPLQLRMDAPYCMYSLVGIRSFRAGCSSKKPEVFTRILPYVPWIESIAWP